MRRHAARALAGLAWLASVAFGGIAGSAHDFSGRAWARGESCAVCHTPHGPGAGGPAKPRWNHQMSSATYTLYASPTLDATPRQPEHYGSKLCLSCHDGTVALDSFGGKVGTQYIDSRRRIGTDLSRGHPIGIIYDSALAAVDKGLHNPDVRRTALGGTITDDLLFGTGNLECASCHDIHGSAGSKALLRITGRGSELCLTCHDM